MATGDFYVVLLLLFVLWQFKEGEKIAQLLLLPYISINSSNDIWTSGFGNTDQNQSLWASIVSEYA